VAQVLREYDSAELAEWMVFLNREHYQKVVKDKLMSADERSLLIKKTLFKAQLDGIQHRRSASRVKPGKR